MLIEEQILANEGVYETHNAGGTNGLYIREAEYPREADSHAGVVDRPPERFPDRETAAENAAGSSGKKFRIITEIRYDSTQIIFLDWYPQEHIGNSQRPRN